MLHSPPFQNSIEIVTMSLKQELQQLHNRLDTTKRKLDAAKGRGDQELVTRFTDEADKLEKKINSLKR